MHGQMKYDTSDLGLKRDAATGRLRMRYSEEIRRLTEQPLITSVAKARKLQCPGHVAGAPLTWRMRPVLDERPTSIWPLGRSRLHREDSVSMNVGQRGIPDLRATCSLGAAFPMRPLIMMMVVTLDPD